MSDILIVGGGPAALNCAYHLAKKGKEALVLEKHSYPVEKLCAGGLTLKDFKEGVPEEIVERSFASHTIHTPLGKTALKANFPIVFTIDRKKLSRWLFERALKAGARVETAKVVKIKDNAVITEDGRRYDYHCLVGADGSRSLVRRHLKIPSRQIIIAWQTSVPSSLSKMEWFFDARLFGCGYGWIFPHEESTAVGFGFEGLYPINVHRAREGFLHWLKKTHGLTINTPFRAHPINADYRGHCFDHTYLIGDAGGFASGLTGEGIFFALASGRGVADMILSDNDETIKNLLSIKRRHDRSAIRTAGLLSLLPHPVSTIFIECLRKCMSVRYLFETIVRRYG